MKIGLFIPCYVDQLYPHVAKATLTLLQQLNLDVDYPLAQTCCGQPMGNTGCSDDVKPVAEHFIKTFKPYDYIVCPSGSCTSMVRNHYKDVASHCEGYDHVSTRTMELCEFLVDVIQIKEINASLPYRVGLHQSCHGLRELRLAKSSERMDAPFSKVTQLLAMVKGIELVELDRKDECCGFGGTFAIAEEAISCQMGKDRIADHLQAGAQIMTGIDMSCLMHLNGLITRNGDPLRVVHIAEILAGTIK